MELRIQETRVFAMWQDGLSFMTSAKTLLTLCIHLHIPCIHIWYFVQCKIITISHCLFYFHWKTGPHSVYVINGRLQLNVRGRTGVFKLCICHLYGLVLDLMCTIQSALRIVALRHPILIRYWNWDFQPNHSCSNFRFGRAPSPRLKVALAGPHTASTWWGSGSPRTPRSPQDKTCPSATPYCG